MHIGRILKRGSEKRHQKKKRKCPEKELSGSSTGRHVQLKDAQIKLSKEECASSMGQRANDAAMKDAKIKFGTEEYASGMGRRFKGNYAAVKDAQIKLSKEECA